MNKKEKIIKICKERYEKGDWQYHIKPVVKNALLLAEKLKANKKVVEISAYLHDIGRAHRRKKFLEEQKVFFKSNEHHITGAEETEKILKKFDYDEEFIKKVKHCVLAHRGRREPHPETLEAEIIACADAMAHFDAFPDLLALFMKTTDSFEEAIKGIEQKMDRNWNKKLTLPEAKKIVEEKYKAIKLLLNSTKKFM